MFSLQNMRMERHSTLNMTCKNLISKMTLRRVLGAVAILGPKSSR